MTSLVDRITRVTEPNLPIHEFVFDLRMWARGITTQADIQARYGLVASDFTAGGDMKFLIDAYNAVVGETKRRFFMEDIKQLLLALEADTLDTRALRTKSVFTATVRALRDSANAIV